MIFTPRRSAALLLVAMLPLFVGCAGRKPEFSGFLGSYDGLEPDPDNPNAFIYASPSLSLADYDRFIVEPVALHFEQEEGGTVVKPKHAQAVAEELERAIREGLGERYPIVERPGPGVLRLRAAVTEIKKTTPALNIHPAMKLSGIGLGGASFEAEAVDSQSGRRVIAVVDRFLGNRLAIAEGLEPVGHAKQAARFWVDRFVQRVDDAQTAVED